MTACAKISAIGGSEEQLLVPGQRAQGSRFPKANSGRARAELTSTNNEEANIH